MAAGLGENVTIAGNTGNLDCEGYTFAGWNTASDGEGTDYGAGSAYTAYGSLSLYAKWDVDGFVGEDDSYPVITDFSFTPKTINTGAEGTAYVSQKGANTSNVASYSISGQEQHGGSYAGTDHSGTFTAVFPRDYLQPKGEYTIACIDVISKKEGQGWIQQRTRVTHQQLLDIGYTYEDLTFINEE